MTTKEMIEVMQAFKDGKEIELSDSGENNWKLDIFPVWDWYLYKYRIKPEPQYVPYDSVSEVDKDKWIKNKESGRLHRIEGLDPKDKDHAVRLYNGWFNLKELFEYYTYEDGTPCGKKVEEGGKNG